MPLPFFSHPFPAEQHLFHHIENNLNLALEYQSNLLEVKFFYSYNYIMGFTESISFPIGIGNIGKEFISFTTVMIKEEIYMSNAFHRITAWLLAFAMILSGFSIFGSYGIAAANADVDTSKLVLNVKNQYGEAVEGVQFFLKGSTQGQSVDLTLSEKTDSEGVLSHTFTEDEVAYGDVDYELTLTDGQTVTLTTSVVMNLTEDAPAEIDTVYVNDKETEYTGSIDVVVNDPNAKDPKAIATATDSEVTSYTKDSDAKTVLLDARSTDAYNGWTIGDVERGGHLKNATSFPANAIKNAKTPNKNEGTTVEDYHNQMISDAGITKDSQIIIYDTNDSDAIYVYKWLKEKGYSTDNMKIYNAASLINSGKAKVVKYKNYDMYVPAEVVKNISDNYVAKTDNYSKDAKSIINGDDVVLLDVGWGDESSDKDTGSGYDSGHVPGTVHVNTDDYETPTVYVKSKPAAYRSEWRLNSDKKLIELAENKGITLDSCVILTGYEPMAVTRMAVILKYLGVENVHVMSSAMTDWEAAGYDLETGVNKNEKTSLGTTKPLNQEVIDTTAEVQKELKDSHYVVVDTRTKEEWDGKSSGYSYHDLKGRIPGTVYSNVGLGYSSSVFYYRNADKSMRTGDAIVKKWKADGIDTSKHMVFFCGSGWRAAESTWEAWLMGYDASLWSDGWLGWSNDGNNYSRNGKTYVLDQKTGKEVCLTSTTSSSITGLKAKAGKKKSTVTYKKNSNVTGYKVYYKKVGAKSYKLAKTTSSTKVVIKKLAKKKKYYVKVRGYKTVNGKTVYTKYSKVVKVRAK